MSGQLCLKWNNHGIAFNKLLGKIYLEDIYSDGTIVCQGKFYPVHRFVLSTCSEVFEQMFKQCVRLNNKHPFIIVKDINPEQMEALLNYMYKGEVNVPQEMLPELIKAAEAFKIKGLAVPDEEPSQKSSRKRSSASSPSSLPRKSRRQDERQEERQTYSHKNNTNAVSSSDCESGPCSQEKSVSGTSQNSSDAIYIPEPIVPKIKDEPVDADEHSNKTDNENDSSVKQESHSGTQDFEPYTEENSNFEAFEFDPTNENYDNQAWGDSQGFEGEESIEDDPSQRMFYDGPTLDLLLPKTGQMTSGHYICPGCDYKSQRRDNLKRHFITVHIQAKPFNCPLCDYRTSSKSNLKRHFGSHISKSSKLVDQKI